MLFAFQIQLVNILSISFQFIDLKSLIYPYPKFNAKIIDFLIHFQAKASLCLMTYDCSFFLFLDEINSQGLASIPD